MPLKSMASLREISVKTWIAVAVSIFIRIGTMFLIGADPEMFLIPWVAYIREHGLEAYFSQGITNYPYSYNFFLYLMALAPISDVGINALVRVISYVADGFLACLIAKIAQDEFSLDFVKTFVVMYFSAFIYVDSSTGQCDSIWAALGLLAVYMLKHKRYAWAVFSLGLAFAFKLQAICVVPVFILYVLLSKRLYIKYWPLLPLGWLIPQLPLVLCGAPIQYMLYPYTGQSSQVQRQFLGVYPTIFYFIKVPYVWSLIIGILCMTLMLGIFWRLLAFERFESSMYVILVFFAFYTFSLIGGVFERYGFLGYALTPIMYQYTKNQLIYCYPALMTFLISLTYLTSSVPASYGYWYFLLMSLIILAKYIFVDSKKDFKEEVKCS